jgi:hypothetical protein
MANFCEILIEKDVLSEINLDQVRLVSYDFKAERASIFFDEDHIIELEGPAALDFIKVVQSIKSEAGHIAKLNKPSAEKDSHKKPAPSSGSSKKPSAWG